jgi:Tol biopolymer transport system component
MSSDSISAQWHATVRAEYLPQAEGRTDPKDVGERILMQGKRGGEMNISPVLSPDGKYVAFFSQRSLFTTDLYIADAGTGRIVKHLDAPTSDSHLDAISFIYSAGTWSPDGKQLAAIAYREGNNSVIILNVESGDITRRIDVPGMTSITTLAWSPDGRRLALSGGKGGMSDLYTYDLQSGAVEQLTDDRYADMHPAWSPDGKSIAFATDRGEGTDFGTLTYARLRLAVIDVA